MDWIPTSLGDHVILFPMTESDPGRAMKKLLHIEPAKITAESEAARFKPDPASNPVLSPCFDFV